MDPDEKQVNELARKYMSGLATAEEKRLLHEWYDSVNAGEVEIVVQSSSIPLENFGQQTLDELKRWIAEGKGDAVGATDAGGRENEFALMTAEGKRKDGNDLHPMIVEDNIETRPTAPLRRLYRRWYAVAACILFLIGSVVYLSRWHQSPKEMIIVQGAGEKEKNDVLPGGNKAVLILANGTSINLDSAGNGELARQGSTKVLKLANGQLAYAAAGRNPNEILYNTMAVPRGGQYRLRLPDGTDVWLNAASSIRYPTAFTGAKRQVEITGEAYFEVAPNPHMPFVVVINQSEKVEVLGTHFNINAYADEVSVNTTLLEGSVKVTKEKEARVLMPGQQARMGKEGRIILATNVNTEAAVAWKNGVFLFDHSDIKSVMRQLARWYDVDVEYIGAPTTDLFGGDIRRSLPLSKVCRFLEESQVHFSIEGRKIVVKP